jgi:hypothetical protein
MSYEITFNIRLPKGKTERDVKAFFEGRRHSHIRKPSQKKIKYLNAKKLLEPWERVMCDHLTEGFKQAKNDRTFN